VTFALPSNLSVEVNVTRHCVILPTVQPASVCAKLKNTTFSQQEKGGSPDRSLFHFFGPNFETPAFLLIFISRSKFWGSCDPKIAISSQDEHLLFLIHSTKETTTVLQTIGPRFPNFSTD